MALKPQDYAVWYQFSFDHEVEFWGFLGAISQVRSFQVNRENLVEDQLQRVRNDFLHYFKPTVAPYNDPDELQRLRQREEVRKQDNKRRQQRRTRGEGGRGHADSDSDSDSDSWEERTVG